MLQELSTRLARTVEQKRLKQKLEQDLQNVKTELREKTARFEVLGTQLAREKIDVQKLEHTSLVALFYSVLGSREQQLEKERQEFLAAELHYQQARHQVTFLEQEQDGLLRKLSELSGVEAEYQALLIEKETLLRQSNTTAAKELLELSEQVANLNSEAQEITEAVTAGNNVIVGLEQVIASLESAGNWGTWDMLGGGMISTAIKHSRIDEARNGIHEVQTQMSQFKRELSDVQKSIKIRIDIGELASFADFFFDGLITDWIVQSRIADSLLQTKNAKNTIAQAVKELENLKAITDSKLVMLKEKRAHLIEHT